MVKIDKDRTAGVSGAFSLEDEAEEDKREQRFLVPDAQVPETIDILEQ